MNLNPNLGAGKNCSHGASVRAELRLDIERLTAQLREVQRTLRRLSISGLQDAETIRRGEALRRRRIGLLLAIDETQAALRDASSSKGKRVV